MFLIIKINFESSENVLLEVNIEVKITPKYEPKKSKNIQRMLGIVKAKKCLCFQY